MSSSAFIEKLYLKKILNADCAAQIGYRLSGP